MMQKFAPYLKTLGQKYPIEGVQEFETYLCFSTYFFGPADDQSVFKKRCFKVNFTLTLNFPEKSPSVGVAPRTIFHPNIDFYSGSVCVDQLNSTWNQICQHNAKQVLVQILEYILPGLLMSPNPDDPLNHEAAALYKNSIVQWKQRAAQLLQERNVQFENVQQYPDHFQTLIQRNMCLRDFRELEVKLQSLRDDDDIGL